MSAALAWCDGRAVDAGAAASRAFQYGDGVFRTMLQHAGRIVALDEQLERLGEDAARLQLDAPLASCRAELLALPASGADAVLKLMLVRADSGRGYAAAGTRSQRLLLRYPRPAAPHRCWTRGIVAGRAALTLASQPALAGIKHLNRLEQVLAYRGTDPQLDEVICMDSEDHAVCGGRSNLFCVHDGVLLTPPLQRCGVRGVTRDRLIRIAATLDIPVRIEALSWNALLDADEAFVCNSVVGLWPLAQLESRHWLAPGPLSRRLATALAHPLPEPVDG